MRSSGSLPRTPGRRTTSRASVWRSAFRSGCSMPRSKPRCCGAPCVRRVAFPTSIPFFVYSLGSAALGHLLLMRFDLAPALLSLAGVLAVARGFAFSGGAVIALAAGTKAYPALFIPLLAITAWRRGHRDFRRFVAGVTVAAVPLLVLAAWMPWWKFASFHGARGLEAESLVASIIWALHRSAGVEATWSLVVTSMEVGGPLARQLLVPARALWMTSTLACLALAVFTAWRMSRANEKPAEPASTAMLMLLTIVAFVATNTVLSPQFHLWLIRSPRWCWKGARPCRHPPLVPPWRSSSRRCWCRRSFRISSSGPDSAEG